MLPVRICPISRRPAKGTGSPVDAGTPAPSRSNLPKVYRHMILLMDEEITINTTSQSLESIGSSDFVPLFCYWRELRDGRIAPSRSEIDPVALRYILPRLLLVDVINQGADFYVRLAGTETAHRHGIDMTGTLISNHAILAHRNALLHSYRFSVQFQEPLFVCYSFQQFGIEFDSYKALYLPLSDDGYTINRLLVGEEYRCHLS